MREEEIQVQKQPKEIKAKGKRDEVVSFGPYTFKVTLRRDW